MNTRLWLALTLTLSVLSLTAGLANAQPKPAEQSQVKTKTVDKASPNLLKMTGKVIEVDEKTKTIKVMSKGKEVTLDASKLKQFPKVGEVHDITYTQTGGGTPQARSSSMNSSRSNVN